MTWFRLDPQRLLIERQLLARHYPDARMVISREKVFVFLRVVGNAKTYLIKIAFPNDFPGNPPAAYPVEPVITGTPHQFQGNMLCLHGSADVGPQTTCKVICDWSVFWIQAYEKWLANGEKVWPQQLQRRGRST